MNKITAFLPCRKGSQRVPKKNIKPFSNYPFGLIEIKLKQLIAAHRIDEIVLSTNDEEILSYAETLTSNKLKIHVRDDALCTSETSTDDLVAHADSLVDEGHILWTHVTSPFVNQNVYDSLVISYLNALESGHDSLMTANEIHGFIWDQDKPISYDRAKEKWPRTQTITPLYELNSAAFIAPKEIYQAKKDRIGDQPYIHVLDKIVGFDIDWVEDFVIAESITQNKLAQL